MTTLIREIKKQHAQAALMTLESYVSTVLKPHWEAKIEKLPDKHRYVRTSVMFGGHVFRARSAIQDLRSELEKMPD